MRENRTNDASEPIDLEHQAYRLRLSGLMLGCALAQSAVLALCAWLGTIDSRLTLAFLACGGGGALVFWLVHRFGINLHWRHRELTMLQFLSTAALQLIFMILAPNLAILFLLGALAAFACCMAQLTMRQFWILWFVYVAASGFALWLTGDAAPTPGLLWLFLALGLALLVPIREQNQRMREQLATKSMQLRAALAKIDGLGRHDPLTGVLNRHTLIETLEAELLRARRTGHPFCFAVVDLDHFRGVNETYGSGTGDMVLKTLSDCAVRLLRALDRFGRIGGEQFGIVLPATWLDQGMIAMTRLTKAVEAIDWKDIAAGLTVTFSAGLTTNAANDTVEAIIKRAENALAQAKSEGRNRIVQAEEALPEMPVDVE